MNNLSNKTFKHVCTGIGISLISSFVFLCIFALLLMYTNISESTISPVIIIITGISILIGTIKLSKNGIITGGVVGVLYILIIYLISSLLNCDFSLNIQSFVMIVVSIICGMIGGIIGVNRRI